MRVPQIATYAVRAIGMEHKVSFSRAMIQALELLRLGWQKVQSNFEQACSYSHYEVALV